jgi:arylsulfatase A-like enzyme/thioredoxin-like negative regulator of GroEL
LSPQKRPKKPAAPTNTRTRRPGDREPARPPRWLFGAAAIVVAATLAWWWPRGEAFALLPASTDQNILLVTIDTLRADALSCYGGPAETPNLDRLASHGARFTFAHSHAVVTLPSHTTILTGRLPYEHGMRDNSGFRVRDGTATLATMLKPLGFATGAFVGGFPVSKRFGLTPGFDVYDDQLPEMKGEVNFALPERRADVVVSRATEWIGKQTGRFFAWVHAFDPHSPYRPPGDLAAKYSSQPYYGEVAFVDRALGPLFDQLATLSRPTLVVVTADHGESLGEHGEMTHGMFAYEATLHVPLIVAEITPKAPRGARGVVIDTPVRHIDIAPTLLEAAGAPVDTLPGLSLRDLIGAGRGADRPQYFESMTYNLVRGWAPLRGVLVAKSKYIDLPIPELYDLVADPREAANLAPTAQDRVQALANTLRTYNVAPPDRPGQVSAEDVAALRALGYSSGSAAARTTYTDADDPKHLVQVDADLHTATTLYQDGKVPEAIALLTNVIARRPDTADAYIQLAHAYYEAGQVQPAIDLLERGLKAGAPERDIRIRLGIYLAEGGGNSARAIEVLEHVSTTDVEALNGLGIAYIDAHRYADAERTFNHVLALDPTNGLAYWNLAVVTLKEADDLKAASEKAAKLRTAESFALQAVTADPSLAGAYTTLGVVYSYAGRKDEAIRSWKHAVDLDGTEFYALYNLWHELAAGGQMDDAVRYARQFVATAPAGVYPTELAEIRAFLAGKVF